MTSINERLTRKTYMEESRVLMTVTVITMSMLPPLSKCKRAKTWQTELSAVLDSVWDPRGQSKSHFSLVQCNYFRDWLQRLEAVYLQNRGEGTFKWISLIFYLFIQLEENVQNIYFCQVCHNVITKLKKT